jgi:hypothetical protein
MRKSLIAIAALATFAGPPGAWARPNWAKVPCSIAKADKYGGHVPDGAADYLSALGFGAAVGSGSTINLNSFIAAECRLHPNDDVGDAIERLLHTPASKLPHIPIGEA